MVRVIATAAFAALVGAGLAMPAQAQDRSCATESPIVMVPGLFNGSFDESVSQALRDCGATVVEAQGIDPVNSSLVRGPQLLASIREILATTGAEKVHILAHSQAGPDSRVVLGMQPEILASITHLAAVNFGTGAATAGLALGPGLIRPVLTGQVAMFGGDPGDPETFPAALQSLSEAGTQEFNRMFPAGLPTEDCGEGPPSVNGVVIQSFGGIETMTNDADPTDASNAITSVAIQGLNDGLVPVCGTHFGTVVRDDLPLNHLDFLNQVDGLVGPGVDVPAMIRMIFTDLAQRGL